MNKKANYGLCKKHVNTNTNDFCPICLYETTERLRIERKALAMQLAQNEPDEFWNNWVYPEGANAEEIQSELRDFSILMKNVSIVYDALSGGRISKPMTDPNVVISVCQEYMEQQNE